MFVLVICVCSYYNCMLFITDVCFIAFSYLQRCRDILAWLQNSSGIRWGLASVWYHSNQQPLGDEPTAEPGSAALCGDFRWQVKFSFSFYDFNSCSFTCSLHRFISDSLGNSDFLRQSTMSVNIFLLTSGQMWLVHLTVCRSRLFIRKKQS